MDLARAANDEVSTVEFRAAKVFIQFFKDEINLPLGGYLVNLKVDQAPNDAQPAAALFHDYLSHFEDNVISVVKAGKVEVAKKAIKWLSEDPQQSLETLISIRRIHEKMRRTLL